MPVKDKIKVQMYKCHQMLLMQTVNELSAVNAEQHNTDCVVRVSTWKSNVNGCLVAGDGDSTAVS